MPAGWAAQLAGNLAGALRALLEEITREERVVGCAAWIAQSTATLLFVCLFGGVTAAWAVRTLRAQWAPPDDREPVLTLEVTAGTRPRAKVVRHERGA